MDDRQIIHVDMDAFFAAVEQLDRPELRGRAVIVAGSAQSRGVVSSASYEARQFGVRSAMPTGQAMRLCPEGVVVAGRMGRYAELSRKIREVFLRYTPMVEPLSIDEAFLDVSGSLGQHGDMKEIGRAIKQTIEQEIGLVASVGMAPNKFLAKLASDIDKPDGFVVITEENKQAVLDPLPVERIWGVGKESGKRLRAQGIVTVGQLRQTGLDRLVSLVGSEQAERLMELSQGIDTRAVEVSRETKSLSSEHTFGKDVAVRDELWRVLLGQVEEVASRLRSEGLETRTVTLKLRYEDFKTLTRSKTFEQPTATTSVLAGYARELFSNWAARSLGPMRLVGFGASGLSEVGCGQGLLFCDTELEKQERLDEALDQIAERFGKGAVRRHC